MQPRFTIGIEEEFQMVDLQTGQLSPSIQTILEKGQAIFGEQIKPEMLRSTVELISDILPDIPAARKEMQHLRTMLACLMKEQGLALVSAGTLPPLYGRMSRGLLTNDMLNWKRNFRM